MKTTKQYNKVLASRSRRLLSGAFPFLGALLLLLTGCERRDLWVYEDAYKSVQLAVDWRNYDRDRQLYPHTPDPDGMTVWFFPRDGRKSFRHITSKVDTFETYLNRGQYDCLVFDYSPDEYSRQEFLDMDFASTARVHATPSSYQVDSIPQLFGDSCYAAPLEKNSKGYALIANDPEKMAVDTVQMNIISGQYDRYIPYDERDSYQTTLTRQLFDATPLLVPWNIRVRIYVKNIYYLNKVSATIAGMADGYYLLQGKTTNTPCLQREDDWEIHATADSTGYIAKTFKTWGPLDFSNSYDIRSKATPDALADRPKNQIRINLEMTLRDRKTKLYYHFDVGNLVKVYYNEYALRIDLLDGFDGQPVLPYVEPYNGMEMDGVVIPWEDPIDSHITL